MFQMLFLTNNIWHFQVVLGVHMQQHIAGICFVLNQAYKVAG